MLSISWNFFKLIFHRKVGFQIEEKNTNEDFEVEIQRKRFFNYIDGAPQRSETKLQFVTRLISSFPFFVDQMLHNKPFFLHRFYTIY